MRRCVSTWCAQANYSFPKGIEYEINKFILALFLCELGSDLGSAAGPEDRCQFGSTGGRERGSPEATGLDLLSGGSPQPQRPGASGWVYRAEPRAHRTAHRTPFLSSTSFTIVPSYIRADHVQITECLFSLLCRYSWRSWKKSFQRLKMPQSPANTRASPNSRFPRASDHSQVSHHETQLLSVIIVIQELQKWVVRADSSLCVAVSPSREEERSEAAAGCTHSPGAPRPPDPRAQSAGQSVAETLAPGCGETKTSGTTPAGAQRGYCTHIRAVHCSHLSVFCKTLSKLHYLT